MRDRSQAGSLADQLKSLAEHFKCPILQTEMEDPVIAADNQTYERAAIEAWIACRGARAISPLTGEILIHHELLSNFLLKKMITEYQSYTPQRKIIKATERDIELAMKLREEELNEMLEKQRIARTNAERERDEIATQIGPMASEILRLKEENAKLRLSSPSITATGFTTTAGSVESAAIPVVEQNMLSPHLSRLTQLERQHDTLLQNYSANIIKRAIANRGIHRVVKQSHLHKNKTTLLDQIKTLKKALSDQTIAEEQKTAQRIQALEVELNQQLERIKREIIASIEDDARVVQLTEERSRLRSKCDVNKQIIRSELNQTIDELKRVHEKALAQIIPELRQIESGQQLKKSHLTKRSERIVAWTNVIDEQHEQLSSNLKLQKMQRDALVSDITDFAAESNKKSLIIDERLNTIIRRSDKRSSPLVQLTKAQRLALAAQKGHLSRVQRLLREGGVCIDEKNDSGKTALLWAAVMGHLSVVQWLLREGGARIDEKDIFNETALLLAAQQGHLSVVQCLLREGGARTINEKDIYGKTALLWAAQRGHLSVVQCLLQEGGAHIDEKDISGKTALLWAAQLGHLSVVQCLLREGGARIDEKDSSGKTALLLAARMGHLSVVQCLLQEGGAHIDEKDISGMTALLLATQLGHLSVVQCLLREGGARIDEKDSSGKTALLLAAQLGHLSVVQCLLREGGARIDEKNDSGMTALLCAAGNGHLPVVQCLLREGGARIIDEKDSSDNTALLWAAGNGHLPVVQCLLREGGARIDEKNNSGYTALLWAAQWGRLLVVQWLLQEGGAHIDEKDNQGRTALNIARTQGHTNVADYLASFQPSLIINCNPQPKSPSASAAFFKPSASNTMPAAAPVVSASPKQTPKLPSPQ